MHKYIFRGLLFLISIILISLFNLSYSENINQNLIENPSVEDSKWILPENWFKLKIWNNKSFFSNRLIWQDAKKSVSVNVTSYKNWLNWLVFKPVDIESNTKYKYSEYYISWETTYIYLFYFTDNNKTKVKKINLWKADSSKEWKKIEYEFVTPNDAKKLTILHFIKSKWILVTDNFSLTKYSEDAKEELENDSKNDEDYISKDCNNLTMTQKSWSLYNTLFTCDWTNNVKQYKIEVLNSLWKVINTINTKTGSYTFVNDWNYSARCLVNWESTVSPMCQKTFTIKSQATASLWW